MGGHVERPAAAQLGAAGDRVVDQLPDELELLARDHRPDLDVVVERVTDAQLRRPPPPRPR